MRKNAFEIPILHLSEGEHVFDLSAPADALGDISNDNTVSIHADLKKSNAGLFLECIVTVAYKRQCDRCLDDFEGVYNASFSQWFVSERPGEHYVEDDETRLLQRDERVIVLDDDVRMVALANTPIKFLCSDDCKGLCPSCGINRNHEECKCDESTSERLIDATKFTNTFHIIQTGN